MKDAKYFFIQASEAIKLMLKKDGTIGKSSENLILENLLLYVKIKGMLYPVIINRFIDEYFVIVSVIKSKGVIKQRLCKTSDFWTLQHQKEAIFLHKNFLPHTERFGAFGYREEELTVEFFANDELVKNKYTFK